MSAVYELIGRFVVQFVRRRYRQELRAAAVVGVGAAVIAAVAYYAAHEEQED